MRQLPFQHNAERSQSISEKHSVLVDTDIGDDIDDAIALALILQSPEIDLQGITTVYGDTQQRARLAQYLLHIFGCEDVRVAAGIETPIQPRHRPSGVPQAAVIDQRVVLPTISTLSGPELIIETALAQRGRLTILCFGPLTNIATALRLEPALFMAIRGIVIVGGTSSFPFLEVWKRHHSRWQPDLPYLHDAVGVVALCAPELLEFQEMTARVFGRGPFKGFMVSRIMDGPLIQAAVRINAEATREWVMERLLSPSRAQTS